MSTEAENDWTGAIEESITKLEAAAPAPVEAAPETPAEPAAEVAAPVETEAPKDGDRARGLDGKFIAAKPAADKKGDGAALPTGTAAPIPGAPTATAPPPPPEQPWSKAPQSLKPEAREKWATVPPEVQQEIHRRERETAAVLQRSAEQGRQVEPIMQAIQPYAQQLAARGQHPAQVIGNFLRTEAALSHPVEAQRAQVLVQAMRTYGVSVEALASVLDGTPPPNQGQPSHTPIDPQTIVQQVFAQLNQQQAQASTTRAAAEIDAFSQTPEGEFVNDLRPAMGALLQAGVATNLKEAYERACWADPRIRGILAQREASKKAATEVKATQRAHAASSSVKSSPSGLSNGKGSPDTWTEALEQAAAKAGW